MPHDAIVRQREKLNKKMKNILILIMLFGSIETIAQEKVSIIEILANKEEFDHTDVKIKGFFDNTEKEGRAIYLSKEDCINKIWKNAIFIYASKATLEKLGITEDWISGYVEITGYFALNWKGSNDNFSGGLMDIKKITIIEPVKR